MGNKVLLRCCDDFGALAFIEFHGCFNRALSIRPGSFCCGTCGFRVPVIILIERCWDGPRRCFGLIVVL